MVCDFLHIVDHMMTNKIVPRATTPGAVKANSPLNLSVVLFPKVPAPSTKFPCPRNFQGWRDLDFTTTDSDRSR
jgi:hypothetical protein